MRSTFVLCFMLFATCHGLSCYYEEGSTCPPPGDCKFGLTSGICGFCDVCAQGPGKPCGGPWGALGRCGKGLECSTQEFMADGVCRRKGGPKKINFNQ